RHGKVQLKRLEKIILKIYIELEITQAPNRQSAKPQKSQASNRVLSRILHHYEVKSAIDKRLLWSYKSMIDITSTGIKTEIIYL
ncbi:mCG1035466, partial [Mus musculus]